MGEQSRNVIDTDSYKKNLLITALVAFKQEPPEWADKDDLLTGYFGIDFKEDFVDSWSEMSYDDKFIVIAYLGELMNTGGICPQFFKRILKKGEFITPKFMFDFSHILNRIDLEPDFEYYEVTPKENISELIRDDLQKVLEGNEMK